MINSIEKVRKSVGILGESSPIIEMLSMIGQVANTNITVLVTGPSGSGKEMAARAIHKNSKRKFESLVVVNCSAIPSGIIESELFGHRKGSYTGANEHRVGLFEVAAGGTPSQWCRPGGAGAGRPQSALGIAGPAVSGAAAPPADADHGGRVHDDHGA